MDTTNLLTKFARIGARLKVADRPSRRFRATSGVISLDVQADRNGEFFEVVPPEGTDPEVAVLDVQPADRHLLLMVREGARSTSSSAATTSGTGSSPPCPRAPRWAPSARRRRR